MYVLSVKGSSKMKKSYYYVTLDEAKNIIFKPNFEDALTFNDPRKAHEYGIENYMSVLKAMLNVNVKLYPKTFAVRKIIFKTVELVDPDQVSNNEELCYEVKENTDALNESSNNESEFEPGVEVEMSEHVTEASSSDL